MNKWGWLLLFLLTMVAAYYFSARKPSISEAEKPEKSTTLKQMMRGAPQRGTVQPKARPNTGLPQDFRDTTAPNRFNEPTPRPNTNDRRTFDDPPPPPSQFSGDPDEVFNDSPVPMFDPAEDPMAPVPFGEPLEGDPGPDLDPIDPAEPIDEGFDRPANGSDEFFEEESTL